MEESGKMEVKPVEVDYMSIEEVAKVMRSTDVAVIDVRQSEEFLEGHLPNAVNVPSTFFEDESTLDTLLEAHKEKKSIVFHCQYSQKRGPTCAKLFAERLSQESGHAPEIKVMRGGFAEYCDEYEDCPGMVTQSRSRSESTASS